ncbi:MAG: pitrilysin family protein, partial [Myxococcota bacterium]
MPRGAKMVKKTRWSFVAVVLAACAHAPAAEGGAPLPAAQAVTEPAAADDDLLPKPLADDPLGVTVHALSNGMRVYISPDHTKPLVDARIIVRAGHRHESDDATGLAHYLEHMLFKGTDKLGTRDYEAERPHLERIAALYDDLAAAEGEAARTAIFAEIDAETQAAAKFASPNEVSSVLSTIGAGNVNAATAKDTTRYTVDNLPVNRLETWATLEAERFRSPVFRLFLPELESVYEEKNRALDNAFRLSHKAGHAMAFGDHPYARPSLGTAEHLRTPAYGEMVRFYDKWYVPGNMAVVLVGDIEPETVLPLLERKDSGLRTLACSTLERLGEPFVAPALV